MRHTIKGVVERFGPSMVGHGDHGFNILLVDSITVYWFNGVRCAYSEVHGRDSASMSSIVELTAPGDLVSFDVEREPRPNVMGMRVIDKSLRNWTLEKRLQPRDASTDAKTQAPRVVDTSYTLQSHEHQK
ncbi:TPA: hypothetical protein ACK3RK_005577 [Burkholderia cepacia]